MADGDTNGFGYSMSRHTAGGEMHRFQDFPTRPQQMMFTGDISFRKVCFIDLVITGLR